MHLSILSPRAEGGGGVGHGVGILTFSLKKFSHPGNWWSNVLHTIKIPTALGRSSLSVETGGCGWTQHDTTCFKANNYVSIKNCI